MKINNKSIDIKNTDKVFFQDSGITKGDLIKYYKKIYKYIYVHIKNRPITMHRFPNGIDSINFYEKEIPDHFPNWFDKIEIKNKDNSTTNYPLCNNKESLIYMVNQGCISPHIWLSKTNKLEYPDKIIFDLDPPENADFSLVIEAAKNIKNILDIRELNCYVMTTGSSGLHIIVPIKQELKFDEVRTKAKEIAKNVVENDSDKFTIEQRKSKRKGRVFIDYLRNTYGQTSITPYAIRAKKNAPIATPIEWKELNSDITPTKYTIKNIFRRLGQKSDPWKNIYNNRNSIKQK